MGIRTARNRPAAGDSASTTLGKKGPAGKGCCRRQAQCVCLIDRFTRHPASQKRRLQHSLDELHATCAGCYRCCRKDGHGSEPRALVTQKKGGDLSCRVHIAGRAGGTATSTCR